MIANVAKVVRAGGDAAAMLKGLSDNAREALRTLQMLNPKVDQGMREFVQLDALIKGGSARDAHSARYAALSGMLRREAETAARIPQIAKARPLTAEERGQYADRAPAALDRARVIGKATVFPKPGGLTALEREHFSERYTDEELSRARVIGPGRIVIDQPGRTSGRDGSFRAWSSRVGSRGPGVARDQGIDIDPGMRVDGSGRAKRGDQEAPHDVSARANAAHATDLHTAAIRRNNTEKRLAKLSDAELRIEWGRNRVALRDQERDIEKYSDQLLRLRKLEPTAYRREKISDLQGRLVDLHNGLDPLRDEFDVATRAAEGRGFAMVGNRLMRTGRRFSQSGWRRGGDSWRDAASGFLGGAGMGAGGGFTGTIAGAALGQLNPLVAGASLLGLATGKAIQMGVQGYDKYMSATRESLSLALGTGMSAESLVTDSQAATKNYKLFTPAQHRAARGTLARLTGHIGHAGAANVALLTGGDPVHEAQRLAELNAMQGTYDPRLTERIIGAYGRSGLAIERAVRGPKDLPYETLMYDQFARGVQGAAHQMQSPYTRLDIEGVAQMLATSTRVLDLPGIDMREAGGLEVASNYVTGISQFAGQQHGGLLGELQLMGVAKLRNDPGLVRHLKDEFDIDINTTPGMLRAIKNAPMMASKGTPQVAEAMLDMVRNTLPPDLAEMVLAESGMDRDLAHTMVTKPGAVKAIWDSGAQRDETITDNIRDAAKAAAGRPDVNKNYEYNVRPDLMLEEIGARLVGEVGDRVMAGFNNLQAGVVGALVDFFNKDTGVVTNLDSGQILPRADYRSSGPEIT